MSKVVSAVFGIGIAVVVYVTLLLGIQAFYPEPEYEDFCTEKSRIAEPFMGYETCEDSMTMGECRRKMSDTDIKEEKRDECYESYDTARDDYGRNFFIIASILGLLAVITSYFLLGITSISITNISSGIAASGIIMILWAFMRGWESTDEKLKFVVGFIIATIVIFLTVKLNKKEGKK